MLLFLRTPEQGQHAQSWLSTCRTALFFTAFSGFHGRESERLGRDAACDPYALTKGRMEPWFTQVSVWEPPGGLGRKPLLPTPPGIHLTHQRQSRAQAQTLNKSESRYALQVIRRRALKQAQNYPWAGEGVLETSSYKCIVLLQIFTLRYVAPTWCFYSFPWLCLLLPLAHSSKFYPS